MPIDVSTWWQFFAVALSSILFLVDPVATIPAFLVMTDGHTEEHRRRMAKRAALTCFFILGGFGLIGAHVFRLLGITMPAFRIAGGLILLLIGIDMVQAKRPGTNEAPGEAEEGAQKEDVGIIPLGMPMLAGPGAISTVMVLIGPSPEWWQLLLIFAALAVTAACCYLVLKAAGGVRRYLGEIGIHILTRLMGMLLTALAVQFISGGLIELGFGVKR
ncbi:MAG: NAAT family transporter [Acidobacteria bacterium]|nr:NAAT family transporter [Acidobacteriota bacterium]